MQRTPLCPASWLPAIDKNRGSKSVEVQRVWEVHDECRQFMSRQDALQLDESLDAGDVSLSRAWLVWFGAAETALADAYRFCGCSVPSRGLVLGRGGALFRVVTLGGHRVRKARGNVSDVDDDAGVFLYRDSSIAPLLDMRRRSKAVLGVLDAMIRYGVLPVLLNSLHNGTGFLLLELCILLLLMISVWFRVWASVLFIMLFLIFIIVFVILSMLLWFTVEMRRFGGGGIGFGRILWFILTSGFVLIWFPPAPFLQCKPCLTPGGSGVLSDPARIDEEFRKAWLPYFCRSGQRDTSLEEFDREVEGWLPLLPEVHLPRLTGQMLADVVQRKGATAGSLDGWGWRGFKVLPVSWYDGLARILTKVEDTRVWPDGLLDAYIAMIPKSDGDATPL